MRVGYAQGNNPQQGASAWNAPLPGPVMITKSAQRRAIDEVPLHKSQYYGRQEALRIRSGAEGATVWDGIKYGRKANGPFVRKLATQGTVVNIDVGDDYIVF
ncbi:Uncharacterized protein TPAR_04772 [Tolypocladium paradoxum]|uniref:Uncharacterized protein n=1 Tax=Tolypocladium paradoxum TaxID=94208 RepID=A0A2S4KXX3_9HYPO|nr:Uncharacterized protein TPAR_04772 [Tolypocladium paradoxum]